jgi:LysM repeat protein
MRLSNLLLILFIFFLSLARINATAQDDNSIQIHIVQRGENFSSIAEEYGMPVGAIIAANPGLNPRRLAIGQQIRIPTSPIIEAPTPILTVDGSIIPIDRFIVISEDAQENIRDIYLHGQELGANPNAFSKVGDSNSEQTHFLFRFDNPELYELGQYITLESGIEHFAGSFERNSVASWIGNHAWSTLDPIWANNDVCQPDESPLQCEFRLNRPSIVLIHLGTNEAERPEQFEESMREIIEQSIDAGVIPILGTKIDRYRDPDGEINNIIRRLATEYEVALWDLEFVASFLPNKGLESDGVHLTDYFADYTVIETFLRGQPVQSLSALIAIDEVWRVATSSESEIITAGQ